MSAPCVAYAAAPTRQNNFTSGTTIRSAEVNEDLDDLFGYLQAGVDVLGSNALDAVGEISTSLCTDGQILKKTSGAWACGADSGAGGDLDDLSDVNSATATAGRILVTDGTDWESMQLTGDATINTAGYINLVADVIGTAEIADADHGDFTYSSGSATLDADVVGSAEIADADYGDFTFSSGSATLDADVVGSAEIADADYGDFTFSAGSATLDANTVSNNELSDFNSVTATAGRIFVADGTDFESMEIIGDCTMSGSGDLQCTGGSGATELSGLSDVNTSTATAGRILVTDGTDWESMQLTGDATINTAGYLDLGSGVVGAAEIATGAVGSPEVATDAIEAAEIASGAVGSDEIATGAVGNAELSDFNSVTATAGRIFVSDGTDWESMQLTGDATINTAGYIDLNTGVVGTAEIATDGVGSDELNATAVETELEAVLDVDQLQGQIGDAQIADGAVDGGTGGEIADNSITSADISFINSSTATAGRVFVSDGTDFESMALYGDCTVNGAGHIDCITTGGAATLTDLTDVNSSTATAGRILIADGTDWESFALQGDCTLTGSGDMQCTGGSGATQLSELTDVNSSTATAGRLLVTDGTDWESMALYGDCSINTAGNIDCAAGEKFYHFISPHQMKLDLVGPMQIDAGNNRWRGLFDASNIETAYSNKIVVPYNANGFDALVLYSMASATSGTVEFDVFIDCLTADDAADIDTESFGSANVFTETVPGTAGYMGGVTVRGLAEDSCAENDNMVIKVYRDATDGTNDTATGDAELRGIVIYEP